MDPIIEQFLKYTIPYRNNIIKISLFGSRARGDEKTYSDYDLLILVREKNQEMINALREGAMEIWTQSGRDISFKIYTEDQWDTLKELQTPFYKNVTREGKTLG